MREGGGSNACPLAYKKFCHQMEIRWGSGKGYHCFVKEEVLGLLRFIKIRR
jgi:hypothetical protein